MRIRRLLAPVVAFAALALPVAPARALNTLAFTFTVDCAREVNTTTGSVTLPQGRYLVTVTGACSFTDSTPESVPVSTCGFHPLEGRPCVDSGASVNGVPGNVCIVGAGPAYEQACWDRGVVQPLCDWWFTVLVDDQCLTTVPHEVGIVDHPGGAMWARALDAPGWYANNVGTFVVTAVWTPL